MFLQSIDTRVYLPLNHFAGLLKMTEGGFLPQYPDGDCIKEGPGDYCFGAGMCSHSINLEILQKSNCNNYLMQ